MLQFLAIWWCCLMSNTAGDISVLGWNFRLNAREEPCLYALPTPRYDRGRRQSCLHCEPDLGFTVIQLRFRENSCVALHPVFLFCFCTFLWTVTILRFTRSDDFDARLNFFRLTQNSEQEGGGECWKTTGNPVHFTLSF